MPRLAPLGRRLAALALAGLPLAACTADRSVTGSTYPRDYKVRHPIVLGDAPRTLDVFPRGTGLDTRQADDVKAFAEEYVRSGQGPITAQVPAGAMHDGSVQRTLAGIRTSLAAGGLSGAAIRVTPYQPTDPTMAAPIRLTFTGLQAKVASKCGLWPQDLGVSDPGFNFRSEPYWNLGCSHQATMAAQVADPVDFVRGRADGRIDTIRRAQDIDKLRQGKDPSTSFRQDNQNRINQQVAN